jgi:hypothetical protein
MIDYHKKDGAVKKIKEILDTNKYIDLSKLTEQELNKLIDNRIEFILHKIVKSWDESHD